VICGQLQTSSNQLPRWNQVICGRFVVSWVASLRICLLVESAQSKRGGGRGSPAWQAHGALARQLRRPPAVSVQHERGRASTAASHAECDTATLETARQHPEWGKWGKRASFISGTAPSAMRTVKAASRFDDQCNLLNCFGRGSRRYTKSRNSRSQRYTK